MTSAYSLKGKKETKPSHQVSSVRTYLGLGVLLVLSAVVIAMSGKVLLTQMYVLEAEKQLMSFISFRDKAQVSTVQGVTREVYATNTNHDALFKELTIVNRLDAAMKKLERWDENNPESLLLLAAYQAVMASYALTSSQDVDNVVGNYDLAIHKTKQAQRLRPMNAKAFVMEAEYQWRNGATFKQVNAPFEIALHNGRFETSVAEFGLEFYLAHWSKLNTEQRILVSSYLLEPNKYRLSGRKVNAIVARSPEKQRACRLLNFAGRKIRSCQ